MAIKNDFVTDQNPDILLYLGEHDMMPEYVKEASMLTEGDCSDLADAAFADPLNRKHPCHTKEACWLTAAYCAARGEDNPAILDRIEKLASMHGIEEDVKTVQNHFGDVIEKAAAAEVVEEPMRKFALTVDYGPQRGEEVMYETTTLPDIMRSSEEAARNYQDGLLPLPVFFKVASAIMEANAGRDLEDVHPLVRSYGTPRLPDPYGCTVLLGMRKSAGVDVAPYEQVMLSMLPIMEKAASVAESIAAAEAIANEMYYIDAANGIRYNSNMQDPYALMYTGPTMAEMEKYASSTVRVLNVPVPVTDILNMSDKRIDQMFSKEAGAKIKEAKALVSGELSVDKSEAAAAKISELTPEAQRVYLSELAGTAW